MVRSVAAKGTEERIAEKEKEKRVRITIRKERERERGRDSSLLLGSVCLPRCTKQGGKLKRKSKHKPKIEKS